MIAIEQGGEGNWRLTWETSIFRMDFSGVPLGRVIDILNEEICDFAGQARISTVQNCVKRRRLGLLGPGCRRTEFVEARGGLCGGCSVEKRECGSGNKTVQLRR